MPIVPVKAVEQRAAAIMLLARELPVRQRTQLVNAMRGHVAEFGLVAARNVSRLPALLEAIIADAAEAMLMFLGAEWSSSMSRSRNWSAG